MKVVRETHRAYRIIYRIMRDFVNYYWVDTFVDELLVLDGIIRNK